MPNNAPLTRYFCAGCSRFADTEAELWHSVNSYCVQNGYRIVEINRPAPPVTPTCPTCHQPVPVPVKAREAI